MSAGPWLLKRQAPQQTHAFMCRNCTQYYSRTFLVKSDQQIMVPATDKDPGLKSLMMDALGKFKERNKTLPKYVVVYRCVPYLPSHQGGP